MSEAAIGSGPAAGNRREAEGGSAGCAVELGDNRLRTGCEGVHLSVYSRGGAGACAILARTLIVRAAEQPAQPFPPGIILTVAGNGKAGFSGDGGPATKARLNNPLDQAVDGAGNLFIADAWNACVRRVSPDGTITTVVGVGGHGGFSGDGGPATQARLAEAAGLAVDAAGDIFVADYGNYRIRKVSSSGMPIRTASGSRSVSSSATSMLSIFQSM